MEFIDWPGLGEEREIERDEESDRERVRKSREGAKTVGGCCWGG